MNSFVLRSQRSSLNGPVPLVRSKKGDVSLLGLLYFCHVCSVPSQSPFLTAQSFDRTGDQEARMVRIGAYGRGRRRMSLSPCVLTARFASAHTFGRILPSS